MAKRMVRAQILLKPRQRRRLEELANREGRSISDVTRRAIDTGLEVLEPTEEIWDQRRRILSDLHQARNKQPFVYHGDLINEAKQELDEERERIWRGE
jgi:predicted DNA-binding protein